MRRVDLHGTIVSIEGTRTQGRLRSEEIPYVEHEIVVGELLMSATEGIVSRREYVPMLRLRRRPGLWSRPTAPNSLIARGWGCAFWPCHRAAQTADVVKGRVKGEERRVCPIPRSTCRLVWMLGGRGRAEAWCRVNGCATTKGTAARVQADGSRQFNQSSSPTKSSRRRRAAEGEDKRQ